MSASSKRRATSDLNHDNWDRETEPETAGTFQTANENELKTRVIRKAVRKLAGSSDKPGDAGDGATKSVFSGFTGFGKNPSTATTASALTSLSSNDTNNHSEGPAKSVSNTFSFLTKFSATPTETKKDNAKENNSSFGKKDNVPVTPSDAGNYNFEKSNDYYAKLKGLNQAVSSWIKTHVDKNPLCLLTPIFKDYEKYLEEINKNEGSSACEKKSEPQSLSNFKFQGANSSTSTSNIFSFASKNKDSTDSSATEPKKASIFGNSTESSEDKAKPTTGFSFGLKTDTSSGQSIFSAPPSSGFSFGGAKPFSFANVQPPPAAEKPADDKENGGGEDDDDEPPKVEFKAVVEEDSVYSKRCKVFVKNDGNFADRGVGTLYLKPVKDSDKTQLLVRADTNLGNILVNLILNDSIPTQRMGKNNVMLVCIPTPETEKPTPMLLRVKTSEEADELLETIDKYKK